MMNEPQSKPDAERSPTPVASAVYNSNEEFSDDIVITRAVIIPTIRPSNQPPLPPDTPITATRFSGDSSGRITNRGILAYNLAKSIKIFSVIDGLFCFIYAVYNFWYFIPLFMNIVGYYGAKNYDKKMIFSYFIYSFLNIVSKLITWIYIMYYAPIDSQFDYNNYTFFSVLSVLIELYVCRMVYKLYYALKTLSEDELRGVKNLKYRVARIVYW